MESLISMQNVTKSYRSNDVIKNISLSVKSGQILGLVGPNGSGKTTCLQALLGLVDFKGDISLLGSSPNKGRHNILQDVAYIADVAVLPKWLKVSQAIKYMQDIHPKFSAEKAHEFLAKTNISLSSKVSTLSKGMVTQVHLALILAIDAKVLILDEPTLGLDILTRKQFYNHLLEDFYAADKCIIITTHQIEEIENILTHVAFINQGEIVLCEDVDSLQQRFQLLHTDATMLEQANQLPALYTSSIMGVSSMLFDNNNLSSEQTAQLPSLGKVSSASLADIFVGIVSKETQS